MLTDTMIGELMGALTTAFQQVVGRPVRVAFVAGK